VDYQACIACWGLCQGLSLHGLEAILKGARPCPMLCLRHLPGGLSYQAVRWAWAGGNGHGREVQPIEGQEKGATGLRPPTLRAAFLALARRSGRGGDPSSPSSPVLLPLTGRSCAFTGRFSRPGRSPGAGASLDQDPKRHHR
jgi:hypothetical protein